MTNTDLRRESVELDITGMTCASCAARVEKKLNRVPGVTASVNYATEKARVLAPVGTHVDDLVKVVEDAGYGAALPTPDAPPVDRVAALRSRVSWTGVYSIPVIAMAMIPALQFPTWQWISAILAGVVWLWGAAPFHRSAWVNLRHGTTTMDTLISLGTTAAMLWSVYALLFTHAGTIGYTHAFEFTLMRSHEPGIYFEAVVGIVFFLLLGRYIEARSRRQAGEAVRALLTMGATDAFVLRDGVEVSVPIASLAVGDVFVVRPGEKVATDGEVIEGHSAVDNSMLTGESVPVDVSPGNPVTGATLNTNGRLLVRATRVGADTQLSRMARMVEEAQLGKAPVQRLADRVSAIFVPTVLVLAVLTLVVWLALGEDLPFAIAAAVSVLIIACPCALGLATPTALLVGTGRGAQLGIVIKGPEVLENPRRIDTIVLDKTGTITSGRMSVAEVVALDDTDPAELLRIAGALEAHSEHPIARAIAAHAEASAANPSSDAPVVTQFTNVPGRGVQAVVDGREVHIGKPDWIGAEQTGTATDVWVAWGGRPRGRIVVADTIKPTSAEAIVQLRRLGLHPVLLTGDNQAVATEVAGQVGIDEVVSDVLPDAKVATIAALQDQGRVVAMVGDGVNDAAALAKADLGIAMGTGTDAAIEAADLTLMRGDLRVAADAIRLSRATLATIKGNLFWAFGYNVAAIPLAALGYLTPMIAGAAMAFSSVFVVLNSLRLRTFRSSIPAGR